MSYVRKTQHPTERRSKCHPRTKRDDSRAVSILVVSAIALVAFAIILVLTLKL
jgi:hypothetical protein